MSATTVVIKAYANAGQFVTTEGLAVAIGR